MNLYKRAQPYLMTSKLVVVIDTVLILYYLVVTFKRSNDVKPNPNLCLGPY